MIGKSHNERRKLAVTACFWIAVVVALITTWVALNKLDSDKQVTSHAPVQSVSSEPDSIHVFDRSKRTRELLFSRSNDLWFKDVTGAERCVASNVIRASFSPDGQKYAYGTIDNEIVVETTSGRQLARLTRASDHTWASNSSAIIFSATASVDYPELEQTVVYNLTSATTNQTQAQK